MNSLISTGKSSEVLAELGFKGLDYNDTERLIFDPSNIRSVNAAFDPAKSDSSNLLASAAPVAVGLGALGGGEEAEAGTLSSAAKGLVKIVDNGKGKADIIYDGNSAGAIEYVKDGDNIQIIRSDVSPTGSGIGTEAYKQFIDSKHSDGLNVGSDAIVSDKAMGMYEKLGREGYNVTESPSSRGIYTQGSGGKTSISRDEMKAQRNAAPTEYFDGAIQQAAGHRFTGNPVYSISRAAIPAATGLGALYTPEQNAALADTPSVGEYLQYGRPDSIQPEESPMLEGAADFMQKYDRTPIGPMFEGTQNYLRNFGRDRGNMQKLYDYLGVAGDFL
jgi:hypothetical protein